ncbi:LiaF domain-containing protein [Lacticaseibacillus sharpeae]|uniref:Uncharacterized protein n=1 Tax=Lacticaseibacillus sharpeae JCM 1186 = DSM 20505 TaxID=1291052 RepID=A0A0R1ZNB8_9LACO|nr:LiaF domain-containing protein [Lacticaseibacillus sharpeae]KRM55858.1 hypothetical protein FC18_GL000908 [Lacticaseibacillus sharpeae JCM 1186 = DSM 20505]
MRNQTVKNIFWGVFFLAFAGLMFASATGNLIGVSFWAWVFTICFAGSAISSLLSLSITGTVFSLAFLVYIWRASLGVASLSFWLTIGVAVLASIGLNILLAPLLRHHRRTRHIKIITNGKEFTFNKDKDPQPDVNPLATTDVDLKVNVKMGSATRYVQSTDFRHAQIKFMIGEAKIYFDQAQIKREPAIIEVEGSIGDLDLYLPHTWNVDNQIESYLCDMDTKGKPSADGPQVILMGNFKLGEITIHYI